MSVDLGNLQAAGAQLLGLVQEQFADLGVGLPVDGNGNPVAYVSPGGIPVWDQPALMVNVGAIRPGIPAGPAQRPILPGQITASVTFVVTLLRASSSLPDSEGRLPAASTLGNEATVNAGDLTAMWQAMVNIWDEASFTGLGEGFVIADVTAIGPQGGMVGVRATIEVSAE